MLRPFLPFRAKPLKKALKPKAFDQRKEQSDDDVLVTVKATRKPVKLNRLQVSRGLKVLAARNGALRD